MKIYKPCPPLVCDTCCSCKKTCARCCPPQNDLHCCLAHIIASIALAEASVAHVLNAEGEKIQKMLAISSCPHDILAVNENVGKVIFGLTKFEKILCAKLEIAGSLFMLACEEKDE
jgi:hypothetical protein